MSEPTISHSSGADPPGLVDAIARLPESEKLVFALIHREGLTVSEAAAALGLGESELQELESRALSRLRPWIPVEDAEAEEVLDPVYLPFPLSRLRSHFAPTGAAGANLDQQVAYYVEQTGRYRRFRDGVPLDEKSKRSMRQIEKDERVWTAAALMSYFYDATQPSLWGRLLERAFGPTPPLPGIDSWIDCFCGRVHLFFEVGLPSPRSYREWLRERLPERQLVPYVLEGAATSRLEGHTQADAVILDEESGCAAVVEAKALSDTSYQVKYDMLRNQLVRNIDCMLEANPDLAEPLSRRDPERSMFVLLTPRIFKQHPASRLYGWLMQEYRDNPSALARDLPHRDHDWESVSRRLGWLTWEDFEEVLPGACRWLSGASTT